METVRREPASGKNQLEQRAAELYDDLRVVNPSSLAARTGATYHPLDDSRGAFHLTLWGQEVVLSFPDFGGQDGQSGRALGVFDQALLAYYFATSDGAPETGRWISFSELPAGRFYAQAFQGYTGKRLAGVFANDGADFVAAAIGSGGRPLDEGESMGDQAFVFRALPRVSLLAICWLGDEDFPPSYRILFDAAAGHHLPTDACAILGSALTRQLIENYQRLPEQGVVT
jgi:hypothetical protein